METKELFLKTAFCCIACDGNIANEEVEMLRSLSADTDVFEGLDANTLLDEYVKEINSLGGVFLNGLLADIQNAHLSTEEALRVVKIAILCIESDNEIKYSEISFFKRIRAKLPLTDNEILEAFPDKEDYLLPDISSPDFSNWTANFTEVKL